MLNVQDYQSIFPYGEVGNSLNGFRDSEISNKSAEEIKNFYISNMGTLRVAKQYENSPLITDLGPNEYIIQQKETKYDFFFIFTQLRLFVFNKETRVKINEYLLSDLNITPVDISSNINLFTDFISIKSADDTLSVLGFNASGDVGTTNFFDTIELPFSKKQDVSIDIYRCFKVGTEIRVELLTNYNGNAKLEIKSNELYLYNSQIKIDRIYKQYKSAITKDQITDPVEGMVFMVFKNFQKTEGDLTYHLKNQPITFGAETDDAKYGSAYYTDLTTSDCFGNLVYGILENFTADTTKIVDITEFQSRLIISTEDKIYVSKILDYNNFVPTTQTDGAFFLKPSTINGNQPIIKRIISGNGLYVLTSEGIVVTGYGGTFSAAVPNVKIAGNTPATKLAVLIENVFYYVDEKGILRAIIPNFESGIIDFSNVIVEQYDYRKDQVQHLSKGIIDEQNILIITPTTDTYMKIYSPVENGLFRKFSIEFDCNCPIIGIGHDILSNNSYFRLTEKNMKKCKLIMNLPFLQTKDDGIYLNDFKVTYRKLVLNIFSVNKKAIKGVSISDHPIQNLGTDTGNYNLYNFHATIPIVGMSIDLETTETEEIVEIRGINRFVS